MFAQLLGMTRGKKDKEKDRGKEKEKEKEISKEEVSTAKGVAGGCPFTTQSSSTQRPISTPGGVGSRNGDGGSCARAAGSVKDGVLDGECDCCGRHHFTEKADDWGVGGKRSMVPAPPLGPAGSTTSTVAAAMALPPLGATAFAVEVEAVERGLHIQLGEPGAKTEAQLGEQQLESAKRLRQLLSTNKERMIQELLGRGWVPQLLRWLALVHRPAVQVEALWALTNIAQSTTEHTTLLLKHGAVQTLVSLLNSPSLEVLEQAMWVLGNISQDRQDGMAARDAILMHDVLSPLVRCLQQHPTLLSLQRIGAWSLCNLFDGQPRPTVDVAEVMPAINRLLKSKDEEVLSHACFALSHLCDDSAAHIKVVVESGVCRRLVQLLDHHSWRVVKPALRTIGNVVCAEDDADYTEAILEAGSVPCLRKLIAHPNREIQKEACWTLSNIAAGSVSQIQSVLDSGAMPKLIELATASGTDSEVRSEAFWVVLNAASCGSDAQIESLVLEGCVPILSDLLSESSMVLMALEGIERVLGVGDLRSARNKVALHAHTGQHCPGEDGGEDVNCRECTNTAEAMITAGRGGGGGGNSNPYASMLTPEKIQALEGHKNSAVAKRAMRLWSRYFVTCAICSKSYSLHGESTYFCGECKCNVCRTCDCTVFHLDYQEMLWREMEGKEKKGKEAQIAARKSKKAKKREKKKLARDIMGDPAKDNAPDRGGDRVVMGQGQGSSCSNGEDISKRSRGKDNAGKKGYIDRGSHSGASTESNSEDDDPSRGLQIPAAIAPSHTRGRDQPPKSTQGDGTPWHSEPVEPSTTPPADAPKPKPPTSPVPAADSGAGQANGEGAGGGGRVGKKQGRRGSVQPSGGGDVGNSSSRGGSGQAVITAQQRPVLASIPSSVQMPLCSYSQQGEEDNGQPWVVVGAKTQQQPSGVSSGSDVSLPLRATRTESGATNPTVGVGGGGGAASGASKPTRRKKGQPGRAELAAVSGNGPVRADPGPSVRNTAPAVVPRTAVRLAVPATPVPGSASVAPEGSNSVKGSGLIFSAPAAAIPGVTSAPTASEKKESTTRPVETASGSEMTLSKVHKARSGVHQVGSVEAMAALTEGVGRPVHHVDKQISLSGGRNVAPAESIPPLAVSPCNTPGKHNPTSQSMGSGAAAVVVTTKAQAGTPAATPIFIESEKVAPKGNVGIKSLGLSSSSALPSTIAPNCVSRQKPPAVSRREGKVFGCPSQAPWSKEVTPGLPSGELRWGQGRGSGVKMDKGVSSVAADRSALHCGGEGQALMENEELVSYLMETGSILALAQRLEEEEECRRVRQKNPRFRGGSG